VSFINTKIHGYEYQFNNLNYNTGRVIYFMKLNIVIEKIIEGLKTKKYDWILYIYLKNINISIIIINIIE